MTGDGLGKDGESDRVRLAWSGGGETRDEGRRTALRAMDRLARRR
ncbi:unnamed protein product [Rhodiola kirilowii]